MGNICPASLSTRASEELPTPWDIHIFSKQVVLRSALSATFFLKSLQDYLVKKAIYREEPDNPMFTGFGGGFYRDNTAAGRVMNRIFLPKRFQKDNLSDSEIEELRALGQKYGKIGSAVMIGGNAFNAVVNAYGLGECFETGNCSGTDIKVMQSEVMQSYAFMVFQYYNGRSSEAIQAASLKAAGGDFSHAKLGVEDAGRVGLKGRAFGFAASGFKLYGGYHKFGREWENYQNNPDSADKIAMLDGALDIGDGASSALMNGHFIRQYFNAKAAVQSYTAAARAADIMSVGAKTVPVWIIAPNIIFRAASGGLGMIPAGIAFYLDATDATLSPRNRGHRLISDGLLFGSSAAFFASAFFIAPPVAFIGFILMGVGFFLLASQTLYDNWERWFVPEGNIVFGNDPTM